MSKIQEVCACPEIHQLFNRFETLWLSSIYIAFKCKQKTLTATTPTQVVRLRLKVSTRRRSFAAQRSMSWINHRHPNRVGASISAASRLLTFLQCFLLTVSYLHVR